MSSLRQVRAITAWRAVFVLLVVIVAWAAASGASGGPTGPIVIKRPLSCPTACTTFEFTLTNTGSKTINGLTIQAAPPNQVTAFSIVGQAPAKPTGVQDAFIIFPATIAAGATVEGSGTVSTALTASDTFKIFTTFDSFATTSSYDVSLQLPATAPAATGHAAFGPSISFSYSPQWAGFLTGHGKTIIRGGYTTRYSPAFYGIYLKDKPPRGAVKEEFGGPLVGPGPFKFALKQTNGSRCSWLVGTNDHFRTGSCATPVWLPATKHGQSWSFVVFGLLPPGQFKAETAMFPDTKLLAASVREKNVSVGLRAP